VRTRVGRRVEGKRKGGRSDDAAGRARVGVTHGTDARATATLPRPLARVAAAGGAPGSADGEARRVRGRRRAAGRGRGRPEAPWAAVPAQVATGAGGAGRGARGGLAAGDGTGAPAGWMTPDDAEAFLLAWGRKYAQLWFLVVALMCT